MANPSGGKPRTSLQAEIIDGWLAIYEIQVQDGYPVVAGIARVVPCPPGLLPRPVVNGEEISPLIPELRDVLSSKLPPGAVPPGGITRRLLRKFSPAVAAATFQEVLGLVSPTIADQHGYIDTGAPRHPGRAGRDDEFYVRIAVEYLAACHSGSRSPRVDVADAHPGFTSEYVRDILKDARRRGLLTRPPPGRSGGDLTEKGHAILADLSEPVKPPTSPKTISGPRS